MVVKCFGYLLQVAFEVCVEGFKFYFVDLHGSLLLSLNSDLFLQHGTGWTEHYINCPLFSFLFCSFCICHSSTGAAVLNFDHKVARCSQRAHSFKPDGRFIFRFGGSAVVYHGKMK